MAVTVLSAAKAATTTALLSPKYFILMKWGLLFQVGWRDARGKSKSECLGERRSAASRGSGWTNEHVDLA